MTPMEWPDERCQFYLIIPPFLDRGMAVDFAATSRTGNVACALLRADSNGEINRDFAEKILRYVQPSQVPVLFENDVAAASDLGADGVHIIANEEKFTDARRIIGDDVIIGVDCGRSRHDRRKKGEMGSD